MEITFSELKQKEVINLIDGKHMGKVCDISLTFPKGDVLGFTVTGCKGFRFSKQEIFLPLKSVVKIGQDAILVKFGKEEPPPPKEPPRCPPPNCPPPNCPPTGPQGFPPQNRRNYDEYE